MTQSFRHVTPKDDASPDSRMLDAGPLSDPAVDVGVSELEIAGKSAVLSALQVELRRGRGDLQKAAREIQRLRVALERQKEISAELRASVDSLKLDRDRAQADHALVDQKLREVLRQYPKSGEAAGQGMGLRYSEDAVAELHARLDAVVREKNRLASELNVARTRTLPMTNIVSTTLLEGSARETLDAVYRSTSWRITKPLRFAGRMLMRLKLKSRTPRPPKPGG